jgi:hypothetical protein
MKGLIKHLLREGLFDADSEKQKALLDKFVEFACDFLKIPKSKVILRFDRDGLTTTAAYGNGETQVYAKDRAIVDIMRSIAHELTHNKQDVEKRLQQDKHETQNAAGSPIENEANATAGVIMRKFGEMYPIIYQ